MSNKWDSTGISFRKETWEKCFRVLKPNGILVFKWDEYEIPIKEILKLTNQKPLFGHISGKRSQTHWVCFMKCDVSDNGA